MKHWSIFIPIVNSSTKDLDQTPCAITKDSSHDVEVLSDTENNNDDDNGDQGHGGGDVADASNR
jgi:hypothetical protein